MQYEHIKVCYSVSLLLYHQICIFRLASETKKTALRFLLPFSRILFDSLHQFSLNSTGRSYQDVRFHFNPYFRRFQLGSRVIV
jgi:hypothetical protein